MHKFGKPLLLVLLALSACVCSRALAQTINLAAAWRADSTNAGGYAACTLTLTNPVSFNYSAVSGAATAGVDFLPAAGVVRFNSHCLVRTVRSQRLR